MRSLFVFFLILSVPFIGLSLPSGNKVGGSFEQPESTYYDPTTQQIFISNVAGGPMDKDGNGWISLLKPNGQLIKKWYRCF